MLKSTDYIIQKYDEVLDTTKKHRKEIVLHNNFTRSENMLFSFVKINQIEKIREQKPPFTIEQVNRQDKHNNTPLWYAV